MSLHADNPLCRYIHTHKQDLVHLICQIASIPSPTGSESAKANWVLSCLHDLGEQQAYIDAAGNVLCPCQLPETGRFPVYNAHIDTVFNQLRTITPRIDGNILAAPSCGDNSSSVAGLLFLIRMLKELHLTLPSGALFVFNVGEEGLGNLKGIRQVMADWNGRISEVVAVDCTYDTVVRTAVGSQRYRVDITAEGGHSWMHFGNTNAIAIAADIITGLYALSVPKQPKTTYNIGTISGGTTVNSIAAQAQCTVDLRSESQDALDSLAAAFMSLLEQHRVPGVTITATLLGERPCSRGAMEAPIYERIQTIRRGHGLATPFVSASTDANIPLSMGIPALSFGICRSHGEHTVHETLELDTLEKGLTMLAQCLLELPSLTASR